VDRWRRRHGKRITGRVVWSSGLAKQGARSRSDNTQHVLGTHKSDFATLMAPYVPPTARMAAALIGTVDATDAIQEALARVWRA
jgi:hypothetical protein